MREDRTRDDVQALTMVVEALTEKFERLEREFAALAEQRRADPGVTADAAPAPEPGSRDINRISFEDLRGLGLSITQAARVVTRRQETGGFKSLDELDELPGFSRQLLENLKRELTIQA